MGIRGSHFASELQRLDWFKDIGQRKLEVMLFALCWHYSQTCSWYDLDENFGQMLAQDIRDWWAMYKPESKKV